jgi:hypothetical protein
MISNLLVGWVGMLGGVISGTLIGLFFKREDWMGGYGWFRRRLTRLGHISFFGLGFLNISALSLYRAGKTLASVRGGPPPVRKK